MQPAELAEDEREEEKSAAVLEISQTNEFVIARDLLQQEP